MKIWYQNPSPLKNVEDFKNILEKYIQRLSQAFQVEIHIGWLDKGTTELHLYTGELLNSIYILKKILEAEEYYDAAITGCTFDPILQQAREIVAIPVTGVLESAILLSTTLGRSFSIITLSKKFETKIASLVDYYGLGKRMTSIEYTNFTPEMASKDYGKKDLVQIFQDLAREALKKGAETLIPGGTILSVLLAEEGINEVDGAPVVEMVASSVQIAVSLANLKNLLGITYSKNGQYRIKPEEKREIISTLSL